MGDGLQWRGLGLGSSSSDAFIHLPEQIVASNVVAVAAGNYYSLFVKSGGSLWAMGLNSGGELGDGTYTEQSYPQQIAGSEVSVIAAGGWHSLFGTFHFPVGPGSLLGMGDNEYGELGSSAFSGTNTPQKIESTFAGEGPAATAVSAGGWHSLFIQPGGSLWAMGWNYSGQLGDGTTNNQYAPREIVASNVVAISAGLEHSLFVKADGSLWAMGDNSYGELGDGTANNQYAPEEIVPSNVIAIAAGQGHSLFIKSDSSLWGMGDNGSGELGDLRIRVYCHPHPGCSDFPDSQRRFRNRRLHGLDPNRKSDLHLRERQIRLRAFGRLRCAVGSDRIAWLSFPNASNHSRDKLPAVLLVEQSGWRSAQRIPSVVEWHHGF